MEEQANIAELLRQAYIFPAHANIDKGSKPLRRAIFEAFDQKDFYTGQSITLSQLVVDHIIPVSLGGPHNVYNYVPTVEVLNSRKSKKIDNIVVLFVLKLVRERYAGKVMELFYRYSS